MHISNLRHTNNIKKKLQHIANTLLALLLHQNVRSAVVNKKMHDDGNHILYLEMRVFSCLYKFRLKSSLFLKILNHSG